MLSYPSSFQSSRISDKENLNPNNYNSKNVSARSTPFSKEADKSKSRSKDKQKQMEKERSRIRQLRQGPGNIQGVKNKRQYLNKATYYPSPAYPNNRSCQFLNIYDKISMDPHLGSQINSKPKIQFSQNSQQSQQTQNSMKTLLSGLNNFCSTIQQTQQNIQTETFRSLISKMFGNKNGKLMGLTRREIIEICQRNNFVNKSDIISVIETRSLGNYNFGYGNKTSTKSNRPGYDSTRQSTKNIRQILTTDLGELIVQQLCQSLQNPQNLTSQQQKVLQILVPNWPQHQLQHQHDHQLQITPQIIMSCYQQLKEQKKSEQAEMKKIAKQFRELYKGKIQNKVQDEHFRLQIMGKMQGVIRVGVRELAGLFNGVLGDRDLGVLFRYLYMIENNVIMHILDTSKTISTNLLIKSLFSSIQPHMKSEKSPKSLYGHLQLCQRQISELLDLNRRQKQQLQLKDKQIQRLSGLIEFLQIQKQQTQRIHQKQMDVQAQACRKKYEKQIEQLLDRNKDQVQLTRWYTRELQGVTQAIGRQNIMRRFLDDTQF